METSLYLKCAWNAEQIAYIYELYEPTRLFSLTSASFFIEISNFLSAIAVIPLTVNKILSSRGFGPLYRSFPL